MRERGRGGEGKRAKGEAFRLWSHTQSVHTSTLVVEPHLWPHGVVETVDDSV